MPDVSEATVDKLTDLRSMLQWLSALNRDNHLIQSTMTTIFVEEMIGVGVFTETDVAIGAVKHLISNASSTYSRLHGGYAEFDPYFVTPKTGKEGDDQARKCINILVSIIPKFYKDVEQLRSYLGSHVNQHNTFPYFQWWGYGYGDETVSLTELRTKYGFERNSLTKKEVAYVVSSIDTMFNDSWYNKGLTKLKQICEKIARNAMEYQKHCRKPTLREILLRMACLCNQSFQYEVFKKMLFKYAPPTCSDMLESREKLTAMLENIYLIVEDFDKYVMKSSNMNANMHDAHLSFEQRLDYLIRAVPYFEEYIQEMRDFVIKYQDEEKEYEEEREHRYINEGEVAKWFNERGFGRSPEDLNKHKLSGCLGKFIGFAGEHQPLFEDSYEEGTVEIFVDVLSSCFYGRAYRSRAQPRCMKERLVWLISLYKDSKHELAYYNLKRSMLVENFCKRLEDEHFYGYVSKVKVYLHILPMKILKVYKKLTKKPEVKYGFYKSAIFCETFAADYVDIFSKTLLELLRDVEHITVLTYQRLDRNNKPLNHNKPQQEDANPTNEVSDKNTGNSNDVWSDSDEDDDPNVVWRNTWNPWTYEDKIDVSKTSTNEEHNGVDEIRDWFEYQGFSSKLLNDSLTGIEIHWIMDNLFNRGFSLNTMYKFLWRIFDSSLEKFLIPPKTLKERLDWIGKLDSGEEYYNALYGMVTRLREMGTKSSSIAAGTLLSLSKNVFAIRRNLLENPDDYGQYNETLCIIPSSHLYLDTLKIMIPQLIEDLKEFKKHVFVGDNKQSVCIKDDSTFKDWIKKKGFEATDLHDNCTMDILAEFLGKIKEDKLKDFMKVTKYSLSVTEPDNLMDMVEWCHQLQTKEPNVLDKIKRDLKNEVATYIDGKYVSEMKEMFSKFLRVVPNIRNTLKDITKNPSPYTDAVFDPKMYELYKKIFRKILSEVYEHHSQTKVGFVEDASENKRRVTTMHTNATQIPLVGGALADNTDDYTAKNAISGYFENVFGQNAEDERDNAMKTTIALLQCAPINAVAGDDSKNMMNVAIPAIMGAGLTASTVYIINMKFGAYIKTLISNTIGKTTP